MRLRTILIGIIVAVVAFAGATLAMQMLWPAQVASRPPALAQVPPLPPISRTSVIVTPIVVAHTAIRDALEVAAPPEIAGKRDVQVSKLVSNGEIAWTVKRGSLAIVGQSDAVAVSTPLTGTLRASGRISQQAAGGLAGALGEILGPGAVRGVEKLGGRRLNQNADIRGTGGLTARPSLTPAWRIEPNLSAQVSLADVEMRIVGTKLNLAKEVQPYLDRTVNERVAVLEARLRNDALLEQAVRREWIKLCRSQQMGATRAGLPELWLEIRPMRVSAAQPRIDANAVTLLIGIEAETRVVPQQTKPDCPFPANLEIVPQAGEGRVAIALPIDVPFAEINRLIAEQLVGKTFPREENAALRHTVRHASVTPSGDRLLISLRLQAREQRSWFNVSTDATVYVWGRPVLDREAQVLRLADVTLDVESEGVFGAAAKAAAPYFVSAVAQQATVDLKPYAANARRSIEAALADFRGAGDGVRIDATIKDLRLASIAFDADTLRLVAELDGAASVAVSKLPTR